MGMIAGLVAGALVLSVGGYFGYKKFLGPKEPAQETAAIQTQESPTQSTKPTEPSPEMAQSQPPAVTDSVPPTPVPSYQAAPATRPLASPPVQRGVSTTQPVASPPSQTPAYTAPPSQPSVPAYTPPATSQPARQASPQQERSFPPAPVTQPPSQTAAPAAPAATTSSPTRYSGPSSGMLMWLGKLDKNGVVTIEGNKASTGTLTGALPGVPVTLETDLTNVGFAEMPGPSNGWKRVALRSKKSQNIVISIRWKVLD